MCCGKLRTYYFFHMYCLNMLPLETGNRSRENIGRILLRGQCKVNGKKSHIFIISSISPHLMYCCRKDSIFLFNTLHCKCRLLITDVPASLIALLVPLTQLITVNRPAEVSRRAKDKPGGQWNVVTSTLICSRCRKAHLKVRFYYFRCLLLSLNSLDILQPNTQFRTGGGVCIFILFIFMFYLLCFGQSTSWR